MEDKDLVFGEGVFGNAVAALNQRRLAGLFSLEGDDCGLQCLDAGLLPGSYTLEISATDQKANASATQHVPFWIR